MICTAYPFWLFWRWRSRVGRARPARIGGCDRVPAALIGAAWAAALASAAAAQPATPAQVNQADFTLHDFHFKAGGTLPALRIHYRTLGAPRRDASGWIDNAVLILHGTGGSGAQFLRPQFAGELFGPGQLLDAATHFIILPDDIGHGGSSKPSDGLRARFPHYDYDDMVRAEHALVTEGLGIAQLRLVMGTLMGLHARIHVGRDVARCGPGADAARLPAAWPSQGVTGCGGE